MNLTPQQTQRLAAAPVGHLSTASRAGAPHVIPVCFALDPDAASPALYIVLDRKPKRAALTRLRRVRNLLDNPQVALLIDHYDQDWTQLWYILLTGTAQLLDAPAHPEPVEGLNPQGSAHPELVEGPNPVDSAHPQPNSDPQPSLPAHPEPVEGRSPANEHPHAIRLLRHKYPQYREMDIANNPVIKITPQRAISWSSAPDQIPSPVDGGRLGWG